MNKPIHSYTPQPIKQKYTTHTKLDYKPPLSLKFNGKELQILEWGEVKGDKSFKLDPFSHIMEHKTALKTMKNIY